MIGISSKCRRDWKPRISGYVEDIVGLYSDCDFRDMFRLSRDVFDLLVGLVAKSLSTREYSPPRGRPTIPIEKQVLVFLFFIGTLNTERQIADKFGVSESSVFRIVERLLNVIVDDLHSVFIRWPTGANVQSTVQKFKCVRGIDGVLGAIDGSHIPIKCPNEHPIDYVNRKGFHSIILQAVCDSSMMFTDVYVGWPGSVHDARVFRNSPLCNMIQQQPDDVFPSSTFLLGDAAYELIPQLITPFKDTGSLTREQIHYNFCHSSTRMAIERAFGLLKGRFRRLTFLDVVCPSKQTKVVIAGAILHNMCLLSNETYEDFLAQGSVDEINNYQSLLSGPQTAKDKRSEIVKCLAADK